MNQNEFKWMLKEGDLGECIGCDDTSYNAVLLFAARYLREGKDNDAIENANIDWNTYGKLEWKSQGKLPEGSTMMPRALLRNYFRWDGCNLGKGRRAQKGDEVFVPTGPVLRWDK